MTSRKVQDSDLEEAASVRSADGRDPLAPEVSEGDGSPRTMTPDLGAGNGEGGLDAGKTLRPALEVVSLLVAPASLLTGLLFYFGWRYTNARASYFGIDPSMFGYTTQDYLLRSFDAILVPLGAVLVSALLAVSVHTTAIQSLSRGRHLTGLRLAAWLTTGLGALLFVAGVWGVVRRNIFGHTFLVVPSSLGLGIGAIAYGTYLKRKLDLVADGPEQAGVGRRLAGLVSLVLICLFLAMNLFWAMGEWADALGRGRARRMAHDLPTRPAVILYAKQRLYLEVPGVTVDEIALPNAAYAFRYTGLMLLARAGGKYFLAPPNWREGNAVTVVLRDDDSVRLEFMPYLRGAVREQETIRG